MQNTYIGTVIGIIILIILIVLGVYFFRNKDNTPAYTPTNSTSSLPTTTNNFYSFTDIAKHASTTDCWTAVGDKVYDITDLVDATTSQRVKSVCGKDGTNILDTTLSTSTINTYLIGNLEIKG